ncbi:hypothetical protein, partial [Escherichia coli]
PMARNIAMTCQGTVELLLEDYKASLKYLSDHPKLQGIAQQNSFKHT